MSPRRGNCGSGRGPTCSGHTASSAAGSQGLSLLSRTRVYQTVLQGPYT